MITISKADVEALKHRLTSYKPARWAVMMIHHLFNKADRNGDAMLDINALDLEVMMSRQDCKCAVLGVDFYIPASSEFKKKSYQLWLNKLPEHRRLYAPIPIRLDKDYPWGVDNMVIVTPSIYDIYKMCDEDPITLSTKLIDHLPKRLHEVFDESKTQERVIMWLNNKDELNG